jgi:enoyl-CoA hydratase/carnithine racemase
MKPIIVAVHGFVLGDGLEISLCCDLRLAADDVKFGLPEPGLGIIPAAGGSQNLPRNINPAIAHEMMLAGRWLTAGEASRYGLVNQVLPGKDLWPAADRLAGKIAGYSPAAAGAIKRAVTAGLDQTLEQGLALEARLGRLAGAGSG